MANKLKFEEDSRRPPSQLSHAIRDAPLDIVRGTIHSKLREDDDNSATDAANNLTESAKTAYRIAETAHCSHEEKQYRKAEKANPKQQTKNGDTVNPQSKRAQKQAIKKEYAAAKGAKTSATSTATIKSAKEAAKNSEKIGSFIVRHKTAILIVGGIAALVLIVMAGFSSCSLMFQGAFSGVSTTTYPVEDTDILSAEDGYIAMETELREKIANYESEHDYDEYRYNLAEIEHDPYVLISAVTALMGGEWTVDEIGGVLSQLFEAQYTFTETVITETRYRDEPRIGYYVYTDPNTGEQQIIPYEYTVRVPYSYTICTVTLTNNGLESAAESLMTEDEQVMYELYMSNLGNRPDLFSDSEYVDRYYTTEYEDYGIPLRGVGR